jgi:hemerythrin-like domain-containing protein
MESRRRAFVLVPGLIAASGLAACSSGGEDVGAVEDLMREHGILRRAILVFRGCAGRLVAGQTVDTPALHRAAQLFRTFGEDYHEKKLEEDNIFPQVKKAGGEAAALVDILLVQHRRGREIISYILDATNGSTFDGNAMAAALQSFELMYEHHAAREDTILFPAWKKVPGGADRDNRLLHLDPRIARRPRCCIRFCGAGVYRFCSPVWGYSPPLQVAPALGAPSESFQN